MKTSSQRLTYIDAMRGLACVIMFQTHCYDSWLGGAARSTKFFAWSQLAATLAAPSFLFLAGLSSGLAADAMYRRGADRNSVAAATARRGAKVLALALLFRMQEYLLGLPSAPRTDLLRVDVLNVIGISIILVGIVCWAARDRRTRGFFAFISMTAIATLTPLVWTTWRPICLPWFLESYINGVHTFSQPQPWLFPIFPWAAFALAGLSAACLLKTDYAEKHAGFIFPVFAIAGVALAALALFFDALPFQLYSVYDFWHTSPNFFLARLGIVLVLLAACYMWSHRAADQWLFSGLVLLGQNSLLVYWLHIEFVYGRFSILPKRAVGIPAASGGLVVIVTAMLLVSEGRAWLRHNGADAFQRFKQKMLPAGEN